MDVRKLKDIRDVLMDKNVKGNKELYYMYRNIHLKEHKDLLKIHEMRWDITVVPYGFIGNEFTKTKGHHHQGIEIYEVLYGEALYIFENKKEFLVVHAKAGSRVYIPYEFWHVTINHSNKTLIMANLMPQGVKPNYKDVEKKHGMAYYYVKGNKFIPNGSYGKLPKIIRLKAKKFRTPVYWEFVNNPSKFHMK